MTTPDLLHIFLWIATLLIAGRFAGDFARRYQQPAILGEIIAGILLGPTFLSRVFPSLGEWVSPFGSAGICLSGFLQIAVTLFLFVAGLKLPHQNLFKHKGAAAAVSLGGVLVPFSLGFIFCEW